MIDLTHEQFARARWPAHVDNHRRPRGARDNGGWERKLRRDFKLEFAADAWPVA